ncbi:LADA_0A06898g1_1 [Lachancea dasiensis]|uniref:ATP-dependent DNA helicase CHL1 n=1 Tax=Lachancea dasiensis TaxID=1072105 RepID=A0A1G4IPU3_9SACH|nr:LADA_0A06898g1_1 [Lachancea dasiensis]
MASNKREKYNHPYQPYHIQLELMDQIYRILEEDKKIGIFESPTGTGKTLSLICPTVTWLRRNKARFVDKQDFSKSASGEDEGSDQQTESDDEPPWVKETFAESVLKQKLSALEEYEEYLNSQALTLDVATALSDQGKNQPRPKKARVVAHTSVDCEDSAFLPDEETDPLRRPPDNDRKITLSNEVQTMLGRFNEANNAVEDKNPGLPSPIKIFFASRTHSQLSQFAAQLKLPTFPSSINSLAYERIKFTPLASRKQLCINSSVANAPSREINDSCMDAINKKECLPYARARDPGNIRTFRDYTYHDIHDVEDLATIGRATNTCPYYASRELLSDGVEIVTLPYQHLLMSSTRDALGINLKDSIVIIDEAHNVIDTINMLNSSEISLNDLQNAKEGIAVYSRAFSRRLSPRNRVNLKRLSTLVDILIQFIQKCYKNGREFESLDIFEGTNADVLNIHNLEQYMKRTKIAYKIDSYIEHRKNEKDRSNVVSQPILFQVASFLKTLTNPSKEGKFFFDKDFTMKYMLLEPGHSFKEVVEESKCVILAGGTMEPISDFTSSLIPFVDKSQVISFSCNHVIPEDNLNTFIVGGNFEFTFDRREEIIMLSQLHDFILKLSTIVPAGMVVFMPSYKFLDTALRFWRENRAMKDKMDKKKIIYEEPGVSDTFDRYEEEVRAAKGGAVLFAVVGGRLSEGINFQDELARAVVMVGLPFPNVFSGELIIRRKHLEQKVIENGGDTKAARVASRELYENICMKAVNQSIGRAIRHAGDYANIYLVDKRYESSGIQQKLSNWVYQRLYKPCSLDEVYHTSESWFSKMQMQRKS